MITITADPSKRRIGALMTGMLTVEEVQRFSEEEQAAVRGMRLRTREFDLLVTAVGNFVQTQDVTNEFMRLVMVSPLKARRIAIVRDGLLTRMQAQRVSKTRSAFEVFNDRASAEAWLDEADACAA